MDRPLRIAYLLESTALFGGVQIVLRQAEELARRGHRAVIVSPEPPPRWFPLLRAGFERSSFRQSRELESADVRVATFWTTVAPALADARGPVFHLCQGYEGAFSFYAHRRQEIEAAYGAPTRKLVISQALAERLESLGFGPAENVGQAFDSSGFFPSLEDHPADPPVVLLIGTAAADVKGVGAALSGLARWRERGSRFRLRRISTDPPGAEEAATGLIDEYHHRLEPERMPFAYRASDLFVGPSHPEEGFGLPVVEALASGLPCVLSETPAHREIAGTAAWYFRLGEPDSLADALDRACSAEARARARETGPAIAARFDPRRVAENLERVFLAACAERGSVA